MIFFRRKKKPGKATAIQLNPESLVELALQHPITPFQQRLFGKAMERDAKRAEVAKAVLREHRRDERSIPAEQQDAVLAAVGLRRSLSAFFLFGLPLVGVGLLFYAHGFWALAVFAASLTGLIACKWLDGHQLGRMELSELELKALTRVAQADPTAREVFLRWKQEATPITQADFQVMENWLSAQNLVHRWKKVDATLRGATPSRAARRKTQPKR